MLNNQLLESDNTSVSSSEPPPQKVKKTADKRAYMKKILSRETKGRRAL